MAEALNKKGRTVVRERLKPDFDKIEHGIEYCDKIIEFDKKRYRKIKVFVENGIRYMQYGNRKRLIVIDMPKCFPSDELYIEYLKISVISTPAKDGFINLCTDCDIETKNSCQYIIDNPNGIILKEEV